MKYLLIFFLLFSGEVFGHERTNIECMEGGQFIYNAVKARDLGLIKRDEFLAKMQSAMESSRGVEFELRWFTKDIEDEKFMMNQMTIVFDQPTLAGEHEKEFVKACHGFTNH